MDIIEILSIFRSPVVHDGMSNEEYASLKVTAQCELPSTYISLMKTTNGIEGFVSDCVYLSIWNSRILADANVGYGIQEVAPCLFLFGSNGGDAGYVFDTLRSPMPVLELPFISVSFSEAKVRGSSFEDFLINMRDGNCS